MIIFLCSAIIYGLGYFYTFFKLADFMKPDIASAVLLGIFLVFMALAPVLIQIYSTRGSIRSARIFAYAGFMWMAFIIIFVPVSLLLDIYNFIIRQGGLLYGKELGSFAVPQAYTVYIPCYISVLLNVFGYFEAKMLRVKKIVIKTKKLPAGAGRIKIMQVSDLHLGLLVGEDMLGKVIREFESHEPDIIVSTGDLLDGAAHHAGSLANKLRKVHAPMGKFAVAGNHEFYGGLKHTMKFLEEAGFTVLREEGVTLDGMINIAGVDYFTDEKKKGDEASSEADMLLKLPSGLFTILLKHKTDVSKKSLGLFDLQLSGHTHKGQIFPVNLLTPMVFQYHHGFTNLQNGSLLYVSSGAGTVGPPIRFLSPPELTMIEIVPESDN
ncbi:MAG: metallophosphoesterase [Nitrospiraceae bacterium]|nr:MAG: metallophosphoesterase [Nitrospiraceae bacterium]